MYLAIKNEYSLEMFIGVEKKRKGKANYVFYYTKRGDRAFFSRKSDKEA